MESVSKTETTAGAEHHEKTPQVENTVYDGKPTGNVTQVQTASVALAAAIAAQKPSLLSKNMFKLYFIMAVGYLVSTMNGFGMITSTSVCVATD